MDYDYLTESLGDGHGLEDGDDGDDDDRRPEGGDHVPEALVADLPAPGLGAGVQLEGEGRRLEAGEAALYLPGQGEHAGVGVGLTILLRTYIIII